MKIYDYSNIENCFVFGDVNGNINKFIKRIRENIKETSNSTNNNIRFRDYTYPYQNSLIIVSGVNYFTNKSADEYNRKLEDFNILLSQNNIQVVFIRSGDNPVFFEDELINLSNIRTIKDYSVIQLKYYNCLCIGGHVSVDRSWKISMENYMKQKQYWENENLYYDEDKINDIISKYYISCIISITCPSFVNMSTNSYKSSPWVIKDKALIQDVNNERIIMDKIYGKFIELKKKPYMWIYSGFMNPIQSSINDIEFISLNNSSKININSEIEYIFGINKITKELPPNDDFIKDNKDLKKL